MATPASANTNATMVKGLLPDEDAGVVTAGDGREGREGDESCGARRATGSSRSGTDVLPDKVGSLRSIICNYPEKLMEKAAEIGEPNEGCIL